MVETEVELPADINLDISTTLPVTSLEMPSLMLLVVVAVVAGLVQGECMVESEVENNFLVTKLEGNWTFNPSLSELLTGDTNAGGFLGQMVVGFHIDAEVLEDVPEDNCMFLIEIGVMAHTFILTSDQGVPVFLYWTPGPDGLMTPVVNYLTMAPGRDERNDLLFLGGQTGDQDFNGMQRIERE